MKIKLILLAVLGACSVQAQTNFDMLFCKDATYTNATIIRATPAYVVVDHAGGIAKVALTNLPDVLQHFYHYDPVAAAMAVANESNKLAQARSDVLAQKIARQKYLFALVGKTELITIKSATDQQLPGGLTCEISSSSGMATVLISGLPDSVIQYVNLKNSIPRRIDYLVNTPITATATVSDPNDPDPAFTAKLNSDSALADAKLARDDKVYELKEQLKDLKDEPEKAEVRAYPTGQSYSGMMIWQCGESGK
jgi:hypothetical protein